MTTKDIHRDRIRRFGSTISIRRKVMARTTLGGEELAWIRNKACSTAAAALHEMTKRAGNVVSVSLRPIVARKANGQDELGSG